MRINTLPRSAARIMRLSEILKTDCASQVATPSDDVELLCPRYAESLELVQPGLLRGKTHREEYPVLHGIPILLADSGDRAAAVAQADLPVRDPAPGFATRRIFTRLTRLLELTDASGPVLFLGAPAHPGLPSGNGILFDDSVARLRSCAGMAARICGSLARLPFVEESFSAVVDLGLAGTGDDLASETLRVLRTGGLAVFAEPLCAVPGPGALPWLGSALAGALRMLRSLPSRLVRHAVYIMPTSIQPVGRAANKSGVGCPSDRRIDLHELLLYFRSRDHRILLPSGGLLRQAMIQDELLAIRKT